MPSQNAVSSKVWVVDGQHRMLGVGVWPSRLTSVEEIRKAAARRRRRQLWVAPDDDALELLLHSVDEQALGTDQRLLLLSGADAARQRLLHARFRFVVMSGEGVELPSMENLSEALEAPNREDLLVAVAVDEQDQVLIVYRGNLDPLVVPFQWFRPNPVSETADFHDVEIIDGGQTLRLGLYEAAVDAILYEFDPAYRRRARANEIDRDPSIGGSIRRGRIQKGLKRSDFPGVTAKEVARIERGEVAKPRPTTLAAIAARLGVSIEQLENF